MRYARKLMIGGAALVATLGVPAVAWAQVGYTGVPPEVQGGQLARDPQVRSASVSGASAESAGSQVESITTSDTLPVTGGDLVGLTAIGLGAVGVGSFFVRRSRRTA